MTTVYTRPRTGLLGIDAIAQIDEWRRSRELVGARIPGHKRGQHLSHRHGNVNQVIRRIAPTKIETRERGALSPLASSKDAAPRREHEDFVRKSIGLASRDQQRE